MNSTRKSTQREINWGVHLFGVKEYTSIKLLTSFNHEKYTAWYIYMYKF